MEFLILTALALFIILFLLRGLSFFLKRGNGKMQALRQRVDERGWEWVSGGNADFKFRGLSQDRLWELEYVNDDLRVTWSTEAVPQQNVVYEIIPRTLYRAKVHKLNTKATKFLNPQKTRTKTKEIIILNNQFNRRFAVLSNLKRTDAQAWLTPALAEQLLALPEKLTEQLTITYNGRFLYLNHEQTAPIAAREEALLANLIKLGLLIADHCSAQSEL